MRKGTTRADQRMPTNLTPKQQRFVDEYLVDLNATEAYKRAGYKGTGRTAENNASRMLGNAGVRDAIAAGQAKRSEATGVTAEWVVKMLVRNRQRADDADEFSAVNKSLELLGKHVGMFADIHEHRGPGGGPIELVETIVTTRAEAKALLQTLPDPGAVP